MQTTHKPYVLKGVDYDILTLAKEYHFLTVSQIVSIRYKEGSLSAVQGRLRQLFHGGYLLRRELPHTGPGHAEYIYSLYSTGQKALKELGYDMPSRIRKSEFQELTLPHLSHLLQVNDVLIAARLLPQTVPQITLQEWRHDIELHKTPATISYTAHVQPKKQITEQTTIIPDAWLDFRYTATDGKPKRRCLVLELDRGTTAQKIIRQKLRAYTHYSVSEQYTHIFGTDVIVVVYLTTKPQRAQQLSEWCEQELTLQHQTHEADLFRFASLPPSTPDPLTLFCTDICTIPFQKTPTSLLWQTTGNQTH